ncbi:hypothetical protein [Streptomyces paromomycinus]|uniref:Uncharacterized protein n=1 Tax=Streptomyces paromomycinus TaxID=92743 RepID=A0A401VUW6_STREY|nr:hypothetical protein [Streptomyces paromomycinus]GCD40860.1 hypothetical protein GKJPGBOP_00513 [Streptomyces paromomycinus]
MPEPMPSEQLDLVRRRQLGEWLAGPWTIHEAVASDGEVWQVKHEGQVLATLPDWAGNLALWIAEAHDDLPLLLAEIDWLLAVAAPLSEPERVTLGREIEDGAASTDELRAVARRLLAANERLTRLLEQAQGEARTALTEAAEFGIRLRAGTAAGEHVVGRTPDRGVARTRLARYRDRAPDAQLVVRTVRYGAWDEEPS